MPCDSIVLIISCWSLFFGIQTRPMRWTYIFLQTRTEDTAKIFTWESLIEFSLVSTSLFNLFFFFLVLLISDQYRSRTRQGIKFWTEWLIISSAGSSVLKELSFNTNLLNSLLDKTYRTHLSKLQKWI